MASWSDITLQSGKGGSYLKEVDVRLRERSSDKVPGMGGHVGEPFPMPQNLRPLGSSEIASTAAQTSGVPGSRRIGQSTPTSHRPHQGAAIARSGGFRIAVSAGAVLEMLTRAVSSRSPDDRDGSAQAFDLISWEIFLADECSVPLEHPDSNFRLLKRSVVEGMPGDRRPTVQVMDNRHFDDMNRLAAEYEKRLNSSFGRPASVTLPRFDLLLILGCGPDGHVCSLFPGHRLLDERHAWIAPIEESPRPPFCRVTLNLPVVANGSAIFFVLMGTETSDLLRGNFSGASRRVTTLINQAAGYKVKWFVDEEAADCSRYFGGARRGVGRQSLTGGGW